MARVPVLEPIPDGVEMDPVLRRVLNNWYVRIGAALGNLPSNLVTTDAVNPDAITVKASALTAGATSFNSTSYQDIQSVTITPTGENNVFLHFTSLGTMVSASAASQAYFRIVRDSTILHPEGPRMFVNSGGANFTSSWSLSFVDTSPPSTSSVYKLQFRVDTVITSADATERAVLALETQR